jgi:hypothetical protein
MSGWIQHIREDGTTEWIVKGRRDNRRQSADIMPDIEPYESPVDGRVVSGRASRREDLKRNGCVEYDPSIRNDIADQKEKNLSRINDSMIERMRWHKA